jgi:hypothetical protein
MSASKIIYNNNVLVLGYIINLFFINESFTSIQLLFLLTNLDTI